ncbi:glycosyltransferase family 2 protein [Candidatus Parcubacteria bacterium]|nr:glycosyltransferase family 2 protein [Patescibacteria group bacterium]MBU4309125.1 glycosyltransferase family 2 protein [Patescibacteria group bacterium]MBU4432188.1 glycosyltransferase family 2 protein [Patescibacteria group bacterium]MBU4577486.1 glycosyltransferase family 2 protein [Patescibacteria group bacterium]MCG2697174.1 glycosyltransferase family 2 protein [Candidatus Parcubacteria bacterium]
MDLSIVIVSWNVRDKLRDNLKALFQSEGDFSYEVIVVDNDSADDTVKMVETEFSLVEVVENSYNAGFARGCNLGINMATGDFILLLNPDMRVFPDTLKNMLDWMRANPQASVAGCHLVTETGETMPHVRRFPTAWNQLAVVLKIPHIFSHALDKYLCVDFDYSKAAKVDSIRGGFFMVNMLSDNKPLFWMDERYFLWFDEVDYCKKVYNGHNGSNKGEVWYTPAAKCIDYVGQSFKQVGTIKKQLYFRNSMLKYFKKWHPYWQYLLLKAAWPIGLTLTFVLGKLNVKSKAKT